jgi:hypothetical protein
MNGLLALPPPRFTIINRWDHWTLSREQLVDREAELRRARLYQYRFVPHAERIAVLHDELMEQSARLAEAAMQCLSEQVGDARARAAGRALARKWRRAA